MLPDRITMEDLIEEARLRYPDVDLVETIRTGREALELADDKSAAPAKRKVAFDHGMEVSAWLMGLIDSVSARRGSAAAPRAAV
jgi:hypothetical protein